MEAQLMVAVITKDRRSCLTLCTFLQEICEVHNASSALPRDLLQIMTSNYYDSPPL